MKEEGEVLNMHDITSGFSRGWSVLSNLLYVQYYVLMIVLYVLGTSPELALALDDVIWLKKVLFAASFITMVYCVYRLIRNKQLAIWCMNRMPNWMMDWMDRMPSWMNRWMSHTSMRVMMIGMDVMVAWMCVEYVRITWSTWG